MITSAASTEAEAMSTNPSSQTIISNTEGIYCTHWADCFNRHHRVRNEALHVLPT